LTIIHHKDQLWTKTGYLPFGRGSNLKILDGANDAFYDKINAVLLHTAVDFRFSFVTIPMVTVVMKEPYWVWLSIESSPPLYNHHL